MQKLPSQLTLGLNLKDEATFSNFFAGKNNEIVSELKKTAGGSGERVIYFCGSRGQGCTHLLQACCHYAQKCGLTSIYLPFRELVTLSTEMLNGFECLDLVCIDDLEAIAETPEWEEAVFHLYNRVYDAGGRMIIAAHDLPKAIPVQLQDLISRLSWGIVFQLHPLSDDEKLSVLMLEAQRRGLRLSDEVGKYILTHYPRHMDTLFAALDSLDKASLAAQRRLTIPFVKAVLQI